MDDQTRYWIAQEVAESRHDARELFQMAKKVTGVKPMILITDGLPAYHDAYKKGVLDSKERNKNSERKL